MPRLDKLLVIDLECTCWEGEQAPPDERQDIIEIGVCVFDLKHGKVEDSDGLIVYPTRSRVGPFCERLTGISQAMVDHGLEFAAALEVLRARFGSQERPWASWGNFDRQILQAQCRDFGLDYPLGADHLNLKTLFALKQGLPRAIGLYPAMKRAGLAWEGRHHRGVDDARNAARLLACVFDRADWRES